MFITDHYFTCTCSYRPVQDYIARLDARKEGKKEKGLNDSSGLAEYCIPLPEMEGHPLISDNFLPIFQDL